jgi:hypothetical protein
MRRVLLFGFSLVINAVLFGAMQWNVYVAQEAPRGQVYITELDEQSTESTLAQL